MVYLYVRLGIFVVLAAIERDVGSFSRGPSRKPSPAKEGQHEGHAPAGFDRRPSIIDCTVQVGRLAVEARAASKSSRKAGGPPREDDDLEPPRGSVQICLSGAKIACARGQWYDVSDKEELMARIHPLVAENITLKNRAEGLVRLVAEAEFEARQLDEEMMECDAVIRDLKRILGDTGKEEEEYDERTNEDSD